MNESDQIGKWNGLYKLLLSSSYYFWIVEMRDKPSTPLSSCQYHLLKDGIGHSGREAAEMVLKILQLGEGPSL